ncbi:probable phosphorylase b kinase regulatory subunit alpha [Watersipora subatra]|uniref:probable phosphorylase b kinase regulatory subunit alpha n=1 Tax=Watersipora subatra TaxID=2589382 RepID=UPI00355B3970
MRSRSNSGVRLDLLHRLTYQTILKYQNPITGLIASSDENNDAWVRDNVYSICSVWALSLAYRKTADVDEDRVNAYELEKSVVKLMRGLLVCMMRQVDKVEQFKSTPSPKCSLHAKYSSLDHRTVVSDSGWGHLQIDATSIYLLMLAQITASGVGIIYTMDEVAFIQNLVFYIESAYRIPDYGIWERGDKTNHGLPELNASSIGMAKAAMEALSGLDLFGANSGPQSTIQVQADKIAQCDATLQSMLPRESYSKEIDSALLSIIGFPAFAVDDQELVNLTRETILRKCLGEYGCCRFLRDGYRTSIEDPHRLHYEPWELQRFGGIECQWPVFLAYLSINESFDNNKDKASDYLLKLSKVLTQSASGSKVMPEMYAVPSDKVKDEWNEPGSQTRVPVGQIPHQWGQSLYILSRLLSEGFISPSELDPLNRRLAVLPKPDLVVQMVIVAETDRIQKCLTQINLECDTIDGLQADGKFLLHNAKVLEETLGHLGQCHKLGLSGRHTGVGLLSTSSLYRCNGRICCFLAQLYDSKTFYLAMDQDFVLYNIRTDLQYLKANWQMLGRPTVILPIYNWMADFSGDVPYEFQSAFTKIQSGLYGGVRVQLGHLGSFVSTSCITPLDWLGDSSTDKRVENLLTKSTSPSFRSRLPSGSGRKERPVLGDTACTAHVKGIIKRGLSVPSIQVEQTPVLLKANVKTHLPTSLPGSGRGFDFSRQDSTDLVSILLESDDLSEQADIIHYFYITKGPNYNLRLEDEAVFTVQDLLEHLYHEAGRLKIWWLIRYTAAMLRKRVHSLAASLSDLLVRQKQVTFGLPTDKERVITQPMSPEELSLVIESVCATPSANAMEFQAISPHCVLHKELLIYLSMFARTEPMLFHEMLRIRIGLIIVVMTTELARSLQCSGEEATSHLLNLSPFEMKNFLLHILSGKEFLVKEVEDLPLGNQSDDRTSENQEHKRKSVRHIISSPSMAKADICREIFDTDDMCEESHGQWARRRRIDGALNRAPIGFYSKIWHVLEQCKGLSIEGQVLSQNLIEEMTEGELKFALKVEAVLNHISEPEYRQLMMEALITLTIFSQLNPSKSQNKVFIDRIIPVNEIITKAYQIFLEDQGMESFCAAGGKGNNCHCYKLRGLCEAFYDMAPSGSYGTISYMCRAVPLIIDIPSDETGNYVSCSMQ